MSHIIATLLPACTTNNASHNAYRALLEGVYMRKFEDRQDQRVYAKYRDKDMIVSVSATCIGMYVYNPTQLKAKAIAKISGLLPTDTAVALTNIGDNVTMPLGNIPNLSVVLKVVPTAATDDILPSITKSLYTRWATERRLVVRSVFNSIATPNKVLQCWHHTLPSAHLNESDLVWFSDAREPIFNMHGTLPTNKVGPWILIVMKVLGWWSAYVASSLPAGFRKVCVNEDQYLRHRNSATAFKSPLQPDHAPVMYLFARADQAGYNLPSEVNHWHSKCGTTLTIRRDQTISNDDPWCFARQTKLHFSIPLRKAQYLSPGHAVLRYYTQDTIMTYLWASKNYLPPELQQLVLTFLEFTQIGRSSRAPPLVNKVHALEADIHELKRTCRTLMDIVAHLT